MNDRLPSVDFHAQHGAFGAYGSFTLGKHGATGGFTVHDGRRPGNDDVYVGILHEDGHLKLLPFFKAAGRDTQAFAIRENEPELRVESISPEDIVRRMGFGTDRWEAPGLAFELDTPLWPVPDPAQGEAEPFATACLPAVTGRLQVDNSLGTKPVLAVFGLCGEEQGLTMLNEAGMCAILRQEREGMAVPECPGLVPFAGFALEKCFGKDLLVRPPHLLGACTGFSVRVEAGQKLDLPLALGWHVAGLASAGISSRYAYLKHHTSLPAVLRTALDQEPERHRRSQEMDAELEHQESSPERRFLLSHAVRAYFACSELLRSEPTGELLYVVNEGEYCMMNTLDLSIDQAFFEQAFFPWTTEQILEQFADRYAYRDRVNLLGATSCDGGVSFTHDMGVRNVFSPAGTSSYEVSGKDRCFSFMTCEELCNWLLLFCLHTRAGNARQDWAREHLALLKECQESLLLREHPDPSLRRGRFETDSSRCGLGAEITTYDSLDASLAHARGSVYLSLKAWACHVGLARLLANLGEIPASHLSETAALRFADAVASLPEIFEGCLPANFEASQSTVLPAIEPLIYPWWWEDRDAVAETGRFSSLVHRLQRHAVAALRPGICLSPEGAWRLSSSSSMTWMSKTFLCQAVTEQVFGLSCDTQADALHARWQREGMGIWGFVDQIVDGHDVGSRLYPRGVTAWLWLTEEKIPVRAKA